MSSMQNEKTYNQRLIEKLERIVAIRGADCPQAQELAILKSSEGVKPLKRERATEKEKTEKE